MKGHDILNCFKHCEAVLAARDEKRAQRIDSAPPRGPNGAPYQPKQGQTQARAHMGYYNEDTPAAVLDNDNSTGTSYSGSAAVPTANGLSNRFGEDTVGDFIITKDDGTNRMTCSQGFLDKFNLEENGLCVTQPANVTMNTVGSDTICKKTVSFTVKVFMRDPKTNEKKLRGVVFKNVLVTPRREVLSPLLDNTARDRGGYDNRLAKTSENGSLLHRNRIN
jgi:hypothetical protein